MPEFVSVTDPHDPRIAEFRDVRERDLVGRRGAFVAEGETVLAILVEAPAFRIRSLLIAEGREAKLAPLLARLPAGVPVHLAGQAVMDTVVGFHIHRGILAIAERAEPPEAAALLASLPERALAVGLVGIANHDNMGGIFRNAAAFGAGAVLVDATSCDPLYRKAVRVSAGGVLKVPFARAASGLAMVELLEGAGFEVLALTPRGGTRLADHRPAPRTALLLGAEGPGLPQAVIERARSIAIPMSGAVDSLNVATTSGIVLHHLVEAARS